MRGRKVEDAGKPEVIEVGGDGPLLIIHGGAGKRLHEMSAEQAREVDEALARSLEAGYALLRDGAPAQDAVVAAIRVMEDAECFNCGRGAALTLDGTVELDSSIMLGDGSCGAACGLTGARHPIDVACAVMERTPHVLFSEPTPAQLDDWGIEQVPNDYFVTERRARDLAEFRERSAMGLDDLATRHGTVGAVARDAAGRIAAATSTGGITGQMPGRVGDSPVIGAGTYANQDGVAVSCTGTGEKFVQESAAFQLHARVSFAGQPLADAAGSTLGAVGERAGNGGVIALGARGAGVIGRTADAQMNYAWAQGDERVTHE